MAISALVLVGRRTGLWRLLSGWARELKNGGGGVLGAAIAGRDLCRWGWTVMLGLVGELGVFGRLAEVGFGLGLAGVASSEMGRGLGNVAAGKGLGMAMRS